MQTRALHTLVRVSELGSFAKVAEELGTTISTVSMQIRSLEEHLDLELFDRSHRPPKLTPVGRTVCEQAKTILGAERELLSLADHGDQLVGSFRIGFVATASVRLLPGFLKSAQKQAGKATFELETALSEVLENRVQSGVLDAAVVTESEQRRHDLEYHLLRREPLMYAIPKAYKGVEISTLRSELPFLQFNPGSGIGKLIQQHMFTIPTQNARQDIVLESVEAIMACVNAGLGFSLLSGPDIKRYASENCCLTEMGNEALFRNLSLVVRKTGFTSAIRERFVGLFA